MPSTATVRRVRAVLAAAAITLTLAAASACSDGGGGAEPVAAGSSSSGPVTESAPKDDDGKDKGKDDAKKDACAYLDADAVAEAVDVRFEVVQPAAKDGAEVCVLQTTRGSFPDLTLATAETKADAASFEATLMPEQADSVDKLGVTAYAVVLDGGDGSGPVAEIGWLSEAGRLFTLRYTAVDGTKKGEVEDLLDPLAGLAKDIEKQAT